jgi:hypothetical protein
MTSSVYRDSKHRGMAMCVLGLLLCLWWSESASAVVVGDDGATFLTLSGRDLNVLMFPAPITMATSSRADLKAKPEGRNLIVQVKAGPADLVVMAGEQTYVFEVGVSASLGAQTINIEDRRAGTVAYDTDPARQAGDYVDGLLETLQLAARGSLPKGYRQTTMSEERYPKWLELKVVQGIEYRGPKYRVIVYRLLNTSAHKYTLREQEFLTGTQKAIALNREVVESGEEVVVYLLDDAPLEPPKPKPESKVDPDAKS